MMTKEYFRNLSQKPTSSIEIMMRYYQELPKMSEEDKEKLEHLRTEFYSRKKSIRKIILSR